MAEPVDIGPADRNGKGMDDDKWDNDLKNDLERRFYG